jgi:hypothetical protein
MLRLLADTNNRLLVVVFLKTTDTKDRRDFWYQPLKWPDANIVIFVPPHISSSYEILPIQFLWQLLKWTATKKVSIF